jgi:hypothetical protein
MQKHPLAVDFAGFQGCSILGIDIGVFNGKIKK